MFGEIDAEQGYQRNGKGEETEHVRSEPPGIFPAAVGVVIGKNRHKCGRQRTFTEQVAQQVRYAKGNHEGIIGIAGAEQTGEYLFADQTEQAAAHDRKRYGGG